MVFDRVSWAVDHRDTEAREGEARVFEVRHLDKVVLCFESGSFSFSHVPVCAEEDAHLWCASMALSKVQRTWSDLLGMGFVRRNVNKLASIRAALRYYIVLLY